MSLLNEPHVYAKENDMKYMMPWHRLANFLGIIPFADWRSGRDNRFGLFKRTKLCLMILLAALLYPWTVYTKVTEHFYKDMKPAIAVMDISSSGFFCFTVVICFAELGLLKRKHFQTFLAKLDQVDANLAKTRFQIETRFQFYLKAVLLHVLVFTASILVVFHMCFRYNKLVALTYAAKETEIYYANILMVLAYNYSVCIGVRFRKVNLELRKMTPFGYVRVRRLAKIYFVLLDALRLFNLVFGWQLLAMAMRLVVDTLFLMSTGIFLLSIRSVLWALIPMTVFILKALLSWILVIYLATSCNKVTKEVQKTITITYKLMQDLRSAECTPQTGLVHDELFLLTQKIYSTSPHISAAGFFPVDYRMLFTCMSCVTSYLIVLIEFIK